MVLYDGILYHLSTGDNNFIPTFSCIALYSAMIFVVHKYIAFGTGLMGNNTQKKNMN